MKIKKRGYRLMPEEEAILRGEALAGGNEESEGNGGDNGSAGGGENDGSAESGENDGSTGSGENDGSTESRRNEGSKKGSAAKKTIRTLLPLMFFLALMMGVAYFFFYLVTGNKQENELSVSDTDSLFLSVTRLYDAYRFPPLSEEEKLLFVEKLSFAPDEEDAFWVEYYRFADRLGKAEAIHNEWIKRFSEGNYQITKPERTLQQYEAHLRTHKSLIESYIQAFSDVLSRERAPLVFVLHDEIRLRRAEQTP